MDNKTLKAELVKMTGTAVKVRDAKGCNKIHIFLPKAIRLDPVRLNILEREVTRMTGRVEMMVALRTRGPIAPNFSIQPIYEE